MVLLQGAMEFDKLEVFLLHILNIGSTRLHLAVGFFFIIQDVDLGEVLNTIIKH